MLELYLFFHFLERLDLYIYYIRNIVLVGLWHDTGNKRVESKLHFMSMHRRSYPLK